MKIIVKTKFTLFIILSVLLYSCIKNFESVAPSQIILFSSVNENPETPYAHIYSINSDGTNLKQLTNSYHFDLNPILTPDDSKIIFTRVNGGSDIYIMDRDGSNEKMLVEGERYVSFPSISPDDSNIVYEYITGSPFDSISSRIYLTNINTGENTKLTDDFGAEPQFSFTEDKILYGDRGDLCTININGNNKVYLTQNDSFNKHPRYSPDGTKIVYMSKSNWYNNIWIMDSNGDNKQNLTNNTDINNYYPEFSPDGSKIVYHKHFNGNLQICIMNSDGTGKSILTSGISDNFIPQFSRKGDKIIFHSTRDSNSEIYIMNLNGSDQINLTNNPAKDILRNVKFY
jgi:TolB protein